MSLLQPGNLKLLAREVIERSLCVCHPLFLQLSSPEERLSLLSSAAGAHARRTPRASRSAYPPPPASANPTKRPAISTPSVRSRPHGR